MTTPLAFVDCETTSLRPDRRPWEIAVIRRDDSGTTEHVWQIAYVDLTEADPASLRVGRFYERHAAYNGTDVDALTVEGVAAVGVEEATRGAHIIGLVPSFDTETLAAMLRRHRLAPAWHYHLIDVGAMALGWLASQRIENPKSLAADIAWPPWKSDDLSRACGVEPPGPDERHTALGDAFWAMRWYDRIAGATP